MCSAAGVQKPLSPWPNEQLEVTVWHREEEVSSMISQSGVPLRHGAKLLLSHSFKFSYHNYF